MTYRVIVTSKARIEASNVAIWWAEHRSVAQAKKWLDSFHEKAASLAHDPQRWPVAPENDFLPIEIREVSFGIGRNKTHRIVFEVRGGAVVIHAVRHLAQDSLSQDDFE